MSGVLVVLAFACGTSGTPIFTEVSQLLPDPHGNAGGTTTSFTLWPYTLDMSACRRSPTGRWAPTTTRGSAAASDARSV